MVCRGRFAGCEAVWERGPQPVTARRERVEPRAPLHRGQAQARGVVPDEQAENGGGATNGRVPSPSLRRPQSGEAVELLELPPAGEQISAQLRWLTEAVQRQQALGPGPVAAMGAARPPDNSLLLERLDQLEKMLAVVGTKVDRLTIEMRIVRSRLGC